MSEGLYLLCKDDLASCLKAAEEYNFVVIDSVQAFRADVENGWAGSPNQVRGVASMAVEMAKNCQIPTVIVGHITKQGQIAGPKLLEHMVDVVLLFPGEQNSPNRLLRAEKNRFGSTDELGIFEMSDKGLSPVLDPSRLYWDGTDLAAPGSRFQWYLKDHGRRPRKYSHLPAILPSLIQRVLQEDLRPTDSNSCLQSWRKGAVFFRGPVMFI
jgi:DNA repair protein RadA/Sms